MYDKQIYKTSLLEKQAAQRIKKNADTISDMDLEVQSALRMRIYPTATVSTLISEQTQVP